MRVLVCGGRDFDNWRLLVNTMAEGLPEWPDVIIHGMALGADMLADEWARTCGVEVDRYPADWSKDGRAAGPKRNQRMLDEGKPDLVVAFPGGKGTADMVRRAKAAGVRVIEVK